jgi:hypothetical protein
MEGSEDQLLQVVRTYQHNANVSLLHTAHNCEKNEKENGKEKVGTDSFRSLDGMLVDREQTYRRLKFGDIKWETESLTLSL